MPSWRGAQLKYKDNFTSIHVNVNEMKAKSGQEKWNLRELHGYTCLYYYTKNFRHNAGIKYITNQGFHRKLQV